MDALDLNIYDIWGPNFWQTKEFILLILLTSFIVVGLGLIVVKIKSRKVENKSTPWDRALRSIKDLQVRYNQNMDDKIFYFDLIFVLKKYLGEIYQQEFYSKTDQEFIEELKKIANFNGYDIIYQIIKESYVIRFSNQKISFNKIEDHIKSSEFVIQSLIPTKSN